MNSLDHLILSGIVLLGVSIITIYLMSQDR